MVRLERCGCGPSFVVRVKRAWWMRIIPRRRLYYCGRCDTKMFVFR